MAAMEPDCGPPSTNQPEPGQGPAGEVDMDEVGRWMNMEYQAQLLKVSPDCVNDTLFNGCVEALVASYAVLKKDLMTKNPSLKEDSVDKAIAEHRAQFEPQLHKSFDKLKACLERPLFIPQDVVLESDQAHVDHADMDKGGYQRKLNLKIEKKQRQLATMIDNNNKLRQELCEIEDTKRVLNECSAATAIVNEIKADRATVQKFIQTAKTCAETLADI